MKCSMKAYAISFGGLILASLDGVSPRFRVRAGGKERLEWRRVRDLSFHLQEHP